MDVDNRIIAPLDALLVIEDLNPNGSRRLNVPVFAPNVVRNFLDVSGDNEITPLG